MALNGRKLGELLLEADVLNKRQLQKALAMQASGDKRQIGEILIELKYITLEDLTDIMMENGHSPQPTPVISTTEPPGFLGRFQGFLGRFQLSYLMEILGY